jgi:Mrp family chromosome partitioning ATPase
MEDVLCGRRDFADHARLLGTNVAIGFNEKPSDAPSEILQSDGAATTLTKIETDFAPDLILIDLPPMMATDDNFGFLGNVDCVLLMVAAEHTTTDQIEVTLRQLGDLTSVMGIVLNKCHHTQGAYGYDSGYYGS